MEMYKTFAYVLYFPILIHKYLFNKSTVIHPMMISQAIILQKERVYSLASYLYDPLKEMWELLDWE